MRKRSGFSACIARRVIPAIMAGAVVVLLAGNVVAADVEGLEKALRPGGDALVKVFPELDSLAGPISRDVLDGKADLHVFYGMVMARVLFEQCQDTIALMRSAQAQECPALDAALSKRLGDLAARVEGSVELVAGSLPMAASHRVGVLGYAFVQALQQYLGPLKEFVGNRERREL